MKFTMMTLAAVVSFSAVATQKLDTPARWMSGRYGVMAFWLYARGAHLFAQEALGDVQV